jgi:hypothetical protein
MPRSTRHIGSALLALLLIAAPAHVLADGKGKWKKGHDYYGHGYRDGYRDRHHDRHYDRRHDYRPRGSQHHHHYYYPKRQRSNEGAYLLGGIVIGSVLTHAVQPPRTYYAPAPVVVHPAPAYGRRLLRDTYGNCFERQGSGPGEVLIPLPQWECSW